MEIPKLNNENKPSPENGNVPVIDSSCTYDNQYTIHSKCSNLC